MVAGGVACALLSFIYDLVMVCEVALVEMLLLVTFIILLWKGGMGVAWKGGMGVAWKGGSHNGWAKILTAIIQLLLESCMKDR